MQWEIPGTVLQIPRQEADHIKDRFSAMFMGGGIVLSQVSAVTGLEPHVVQNWVKRGFLSAPIQKRYTLRQLCRIVIINMLRGALPLERICGLLTYINGHLNDESDDMIDDTQLYFMFLTLAARAKELDNDEERDAILEETLVRYQEPAPGAKERVKNVLSVMLTAYVASRMRQEAEKMLDGLSGAEK